VSAAPRRKRVVFGAIASTALAATAVAWVGVGAPLLQWHRHMQAISGALAGAPSDDPFSGHWTGEHSTLWVSPTGLAAMQQGGCRGTTGRRIGTATLEDARVVIQWKDESETLLPVVWGERRYLVSGEYPLLFCASIREASHNFGVYARNVDWRAKSVGIPKASAEDLRCLGGNTVKASLTARLQDWSQNGDRLSAEFEIDAGWDDLVFLRRPFEILKPNGIPTTLREFPAYPKEHHRSRIHVSVYPGEQRPEVGWIAQSRLEDALADYRPAPEDTHEGVDHNQ